jgi:hypothetical protein
MLRVSEKPGARLLIREGLAVAVAVGFAFEVETMFSQENLVGGPLPPPRDSVKVGR